jgi:hypothetical protein
MEIIILNTYVLNQKIPRKLPGPEESVHPLQNNIPAKTKRNTMKTEVTSGAKWDGCLSLNSNTYSKALKNHPGF